MGISLGVHFATASEKNGVIKCIPEHKYRKMPIQQEKETGKFVLEFKAMQKKFYFKPEPEVPYWWCSAKFVPNDDSKVVVTSGAFNPRSNHAWLSVKHIPNGRIMLVNILSENTLSGEMFPDSRMANYPRLHLHPSGKFIGYIGLEGVKIATTSQQELYCKLKDLRSCNYRTCSFSPNGKHLAIILSANQSFELLISKVDKASTYGDTSVNLSHMFPNFRFSRMYNEHIECKWSQDSELIAVCSNNFCLLVLNNKLEKVTDVVEDILPENRFPGWSGTFDFDPCSRHDLLAVGTNHGHVYVVSTDTKNILLETESLTKEAIDYLKYNPQGTHIAVATRDMCILLIDSTTGHISLTIDILSQCTEIGQRLASFPAITSMDFSTTGDYLVTGSCDGMVRIWKMKTEFSLFSLCTLTVLSCTPPSEVKELPLPSQIIDKLLGFPSYK